MTTNEVADYYILFDLTIGRLYKNRQLKKMIGLINRQILGFFHNYFLFRMRNCQKGIQNSFIKFYSNNIWIRIKFIKKL